MLLSNNICQKQVRYKLELCETRLMIKVILPQDMIFKLIVMFNSKILNEWIKIIENLTQKEKSINNFRF